MDIVKLAERELMRSGADVTEIGKSVCGTPILAAHRGGYGGKQIVITSAIHARECYTALVTLNQLREFGGRGMGESGSGVYFVPLLNPDGAQFFESGITHGKPVLEAFAARRTEYKANADGVDLNCNFDANFGSGRLNRTSVAPSGYIGEYPLCAPESAALVRFTRKVAPAATVSYHCMGGELYWEFFQTGDARRRDKAIATAVAKHIGVKRVDGDLGSAGGYKDYCVQKLGIPAVTIEVVHSGEHPFAPRDFEPDIRANADLPGFLLDLL